MTGNEQLVASLFEIFVIGCFALSWAFIDWHKSRTKKLEKKLATIANETDRTDDEFSDWDTRFQKTTNIREIPAHMQLYRHIVEHEATLTRRAEEKGKL